MSEQDGNAPERAFLLTLAYNGANYCGWQRQLNEPTVQEAVERSVASLLSIDSIVVHSSSRTDAGVHALGQAAVFRTDKWKPPAAKLPLALNTHLPGDIVARNAVEVPLTFNPLRDNHGKRYRYFAYCSRKADPIGSGTHWWVKQLVNPELLRDAANRVVGKHDFYSFQSVGSPRRSTVRHVRSLEITSREHMDGTMYQFDIEADGFLYNMVRNIVGTLIQISVGRKSPAWIDEILAARDREVAGAAAPPQGLFLLEVLF